MKRELQWYQPARWALSAIRFYQRAISSRTGTNCRYLPTCSSYAAEAVETHGAVRGLWLAGKRIVRCNPWSTDGFVHQPVPPVRSARNA